MPTPIARYSRTAVILHWLLAAVLVANVALALSVDFWPDAWVRPVIDTHKSLGITALGLVVLRLLWRSTHRPPPLPDSHPGWQRSMARAAHATLYLLMIVLPLSGWLHDSAWKDAATHPMQLFGLVPWPRIGFIEAMAPATKEAMHTLFGQVHEALGYALYALVALHVGAAIKHQWFDREAQLQRMSL